MANELSDYIDGELSAGRLKALERHLAACTCCSGFADSLRRAVEACRRSGRTTLPATVRRRAQARIEQLLAEGTDRPGRPR